MKRPPDQVSAGPDAWSGGPLRAHRTGAAAWPVLLRAWLRHPARRGPALAAVSGGFLIAMAA